MFFINQWNLIVLLVALGMSNLASASIPLATQIIDYSEDYYNNQGSWGAFSSPTFQLSGGTIGLNVTCLSDGKGSQNHIFHDLFIGLYRADDPVFAPYVKANLGGYGNTISSINNISYPDRAFGNSGNSNNGILLANNKAPEIGTPVSIQIILDGAGNTITFSFPNGDTYTYKCDNVASINQIGFAAGGNRIQYEIYAGIIPLNSTTPPWNVSTTPPDTTTWYNSTTPPDTTTWLNSTTPPWNVSTTPPDTTTWYNSTTPPDTTTWLNSTTPPQKATAPLSTTTPAALAPENTSQRSTAIDQKMLLFTSSAASLNGPGGMPMATNGTTAKKSSQKPSPKPKPHKTAKPVAKKATPQQKTKKAKK
jgi:hypothetical protein